MALQFAPNSLAGKEQRFEILMIGRFCQKQESLNEIEQTKRKSCSVKMTSNNHNDINDLAELCAHVILPEIGSPISLTLGIVCLKFFFYSICYACSRIG